jgi:hypothetical protein
MCANSTGRAQAFLSASDAAVSQEVADGKIGIQSACALNTRYDKAPIFRRVKIFQVQILFWICKFKVFLECSGKTRGC